MSQFDTSLKRVVQGKLKADEFVRWFTNLDDGDKCVVLLELNTYSMRCQHYAKLASDNFVLTERNEETNEHD